MIERATINLKADSIDSSKLNRSKNSDTKDSFEKALEKEDKNLETKQEDSNTKLEEKPKKESEKLIKEKTPEDQESKTEKNDDYIVEIVSFLNIKDLTEASNKHDFPGQNLEEIRLEVSTEKLENITNTQVNQNEVIKTEVNPEEASKGAKEEVLLESAKDLKVLKKSEKDEGSEIKLEDVKSSKEGSEKKIVQTFKGESSHNNDLKEEIHKKLDILKENINAIDDKKEEETTFSENLKNTIEGAKENLNQQKIVTEAGANKVTDKSVVDKENIIDQLAKNITTGKTDNGSFIKIQLKPEVLGEMTIKLTQGKEGMIATISAEKEVVKNVLRNTGEQITTMLSEKNIKVTSVVIETNESEKQESNLFEGTRQEDFTGGENRKENFTNSGFDNYGEKVEGERSGIRSSEIYSGNGINFYV